MVSSKEGSFASSEQMSVQGRPPAPLLADLSCPECHELEGHTMACSEKLPLELCNGSTPECPHYACPDGWHDGDAPNCSCTPDCALAPITCSACGNDMNVEPHAADCRAAAYIASWSTALR